MLKVGLIAGIVNLILGLGFNWLIGILLPTLIAEYQNPSLFRPWTDPLMQIYFLYPFIFAFVLYYLWNLLNAKFSGGYSQKAFQFAKIYFIIAIPGMFISFSSFQVSLLMILSWIFLGFVQAFFAGYIFARFK